MNAPQPRYQAVKDHVLALIADGRLKPGDRLPSEAELTAELGVSRMTANRAIRELKADGRVERVPGVGTFVAAPKAQGDLVRLRDIAEEVRASGGVQVHAMDVLRRETVSANARLAAAFEIDQGAPLVHLVIRHRQDGTPVLIEDRLIHPELAPGADGADFAAITTHAFLTAAAPLQDVEHVVRAVAADAFIARVLALPHGAPCLQVRRRTWSAGRVVSAASLTYAGDRYEIAGHPGPSPQTQG